VHTPPSPAADREDGRSARKRQAVMRAATELFLARGYQATSMDDIAAAAAVSKPTVYRHFTDKERLFVAIVLDTLDRIGDPFRDQVHALATSAAVEADLRALAGSYLETVTRPEVIRLRRLVVGEAGRLPELARAYHERAAARTLASLAEGFAGLDRRGALRVDDPAGAAAHFAFLVIGPALDAALFGVPDATDADRAATVEAAVRVFLAAYGRAPGTPAPA